MALKEFLLPDLGEGLEDAEVIRWLVAEGDEISLNQPLVEVETAKALVEIPSPQAGKVSKLHASEADTVKVGSTLVTFEVAEDATENKPELLVGYGAGETKAGRRRRLVAPDTKKAETHAERVPVKGIRKSVADKMALSKKEIPHVTTFLTFDATEVMAKREQLKTSTDTRITPFTVIAKAFVDLCADHRELNSSFDARSSEIVLYKDVNLGVATDTTRGLIVVVVKDAQSLDITALGAEISRLVDAARNGKATLEELSGSTVTISNVGSFGAESGTPIINHPEAAILAVGVIEERAAVVDGKVIARPECTLALAFDHRVLDGAQAGRAMLDLRKRLETIAD